MYDHVGLRVKDFARSRAFYEKALAPLGIEMLDRSEESAGFGSKGRIQLWVQTGTPVSTGTHLAFSSPDRAAVQAFHAAALKSGGRDNGAPGLRADYAPTYYAAFVHDPDGNNIEAVCHTEK